jgi:hypothetical protein
LAANALFPFSITCREIRSRCVRDRGDLDGVTGRLGETDATSDGIGCMARLAGRRSSGPDSGCMATITKVTPAKTPSATIARSSAPHPSNNGETFVP